MLDAEVAERFDLETAFDSQLEAFSALAAGDCELSPKFFLDGDGTVPTVFTYGARASARGAACVRVACVGGVENHRRGLPELDAVLVIGDPGTGLVRAIVDGVRFTQIRTAAAAAVAAEHLARRDARRLALLGSGPQADACAAAIARVRALDGVSLWSPTPDHRAAAVARIGASLRLPVREAASAADAVRSSDLIVAATNSRRPVFDGADVLPGALVVSLGSFRPDRCEVDDELLERAAVVVVDHPPAALETAGPVIRWAARGAGRAPLAIGAVIGGCSARRSDDEILFFNSVGLGVQDAAAAEWLLRAIELGGVGTTLAQLVRGA